MLQFDSIRAVIPDRFVLFSPYSYKQGNTAIHNYGKYKRSLGLYVGEGIEYWEECTVLRDYLNSCYESFESDKKLLFVCRIEFCKDYVFEGNLGEFFKRLNRSLEALPVRYTVLFSSKKYCAITYKGQQWVIYSKPKRNGKYYENIIRFEYRLLKNKSVIEFLGKSVSLADICDVDKYELYNQIFIEKWYEIFNLLQIEEQGDSLEALIAQAVEYSKLKDGTVNYQVVEKILVGNLLRNTYGKSWYQALDPREPKGKRRLMLWRDRLDSETQSFYDWKEEMGLAGVKGLKELLAKMVTN